MKRSCFFLSLFTLLAFFLSSCDQVLALFSPSRSGSRTYSVTVLVTGNDEDAELNLMDDGRVVWVWAEVFNGAFSEGSIFLTRSSQFWSGSISLIATDELEFRVLAGSGDILAAKEIFWGGRAVFIPGNASSIGLALSLGSPPDSDDVGPVVDLPEWSDGFETGDLSAQSWVLSTVTQEAREPEVTSEWAASGSYALEFPSAAMSDGGRTSAAFTVTLSEPRVLSFQYKTDIGDTFVDGNGDTVSLETTFQFYLDNVSQGSWNGLGGEWTQVSFIIPIGTHTLRWTLEKDSDWTYNQLTITNKVWLDDVTLVADATSSMVITPRGRLDLVAGGSGWQFSAASLRSDGSARTGLDYTYSVQTVSGGGGSLDVFGNFIPTQAGTCRIRATGSDGVGEVSELITIHPADYWTRPFVYAGIAYLGKAAGGTDTPLSDASTAVSIFSPSEYSFNADGFFMMTGTITDPSVYDYALVRVVKESTEESTSYYVQGNFVQRIWLRFGSGSYTISVFELASLTMDLSGQGDFSGASYYSTPHYSFEVNNIRDEVGIFLYPSGPIQSDDFAISNIRNDLAAGLTDETDRIKAFHDYVVRLLHYDHDSLEDGQRKKQDALSSWANRTAVCEGYTSLMTALLRADGIRTKAVSGYATASGEGHAWNNILLGNSWYFLDATWDDPYFDSGDDRVAYYYFMLPNLDGVNGDHTWEDDRAGRAIGTAGNPTWLGFPDGWY